MAGRAVRNQVSMVGESASKLGSSFKRVGTSVASGLYGRIKSMPSPIAAGDGRQQEDEEEPTYVPERKKVEIPPLNYYREESAPEQKPAASLTLAAAAAAPAAPPPPTSHPDEEATESRPPAPVFAAPTIKQAAKSKPPAAAAAPNKVKTAPENGKAAAKANGSGRPARKARKSASGKKAAKVSAASRFGEHMQAAEQALKRAASGVQEDRIRHLQEAISHYEAAVKYSSSLSLYRLWGNALLEQARLAPADGLLESAAEKFHQGEKIKPGAMSADLALACALAGKEDECRQAVGRCLQNGQADLEEHFGSAAFDRYRSADWFVSAQKKISA